MGRPLQDDLGRRLFEVRMDCYACISTVFDALLFAPSADNESLKFKVSFNLNLSEIFPPHFFTPETIFLM